MNRLQGKAAIVTGGVLGIGRACAIRMAEEGASIGLIDVLDKQGQVLTEKGMPEQRVHFDSFGV